GPRETKARATGERLYKALPGAMIAVDEAQGTVDAIVSVFGIVDDGDDIIHAGSFTKTLTERAGRIRVLDSHNNWSTISVVGKPLEMREVGRDELPDEIRTKYPDATGGLWTRTQYLIDTPEGMGVFKRIAAGAVSEYSIGFDIVGKADYSKIERDGKSRTVRNIREVRFWEYSPVVWGMNPATATVAVKAATTFEDLPLADRDRAWDGAAAEGRVRDWAGGDEAMDWAAYRRAFMWYDEAAPEQVGSYKLGFADVIDGTLTAIPRGVMAVGNVLQGGRGGVDIPTGDEDGVKAHCERYYTKMRETFDDDTLVPPWNKSRKEYTPDGPQPRLGDNLVADVQSILTSRIGSYLKDGYIDGDEHSDLLALVEDVIALIRDRLPEDLALRPLPSWSMMDWFFFAGHGPDLAKAGRVLSQRNWDRVTSARDLLTDVLDSAGVGDAAADDGDSKATAPGDSPRATLDQEEAPPLAGSTPPPAPTSEEAGPQPGDSPTGDTMLLARARLALTTLEELR
ncbi:MAG TPA: HK97 family phage prohead protease, partial [Aggregatilinea sp.]